MSGGSGWSRWAWGAALRPETVRLCAVVVAIVGLLVLLMHLVLSVGTGLRGYVRGEGLWSVARHQAMGHLERYLDEGGEAHWQAYVSRLAVPLADRRARLALEDPSVDAATVRAAFLAAEHHPDDVPMMIRLYHTFRWQPDFARALETWRASDRSILELQELGDGIRAARLAAEGAGTDLDAAVLDAALAELRGIGDALEPLEREFSEAIGRAARWADARLRIVVVAAALLLLAVGAEAVLRLTARAFAADERFRRTFEEAPVGMVQIHPDGRWIAANAAMARILGVPREGLAGPPPLDLFGPADPAVPPDVDGAPALRVHRRPDGEEAWLATEVTAIAGMDGRTLHYVAVVQDVTESRRLAGELAHRARHDHLTGLANRFEFERRLEAALARAAGGGAPSALAFLDLDGFKTVNDSSGHAAGDAVLVEVADALRRSVRAGDTLARLGGDEFVVLLEGCAIAAARPLAEHVREAIGALTFEWHDGRRYRLGASVGLVALDGTEPDPSKVLSAADAACYAAKRSGRPVVHVASPGPGGAAELARPGGP